MAKKKPKTFERDGDTAFAYTPADEVRLVYNGWSERKPAPTPPSADATADEGATTTKPTKAGGRKAD